MAVNVNLKIVYKFYLNNLEVKKTEFINFIYIFRFIIETCLLKGFLKLILINRKCNKLKNCDGSRDLNFDSGKLYTFETALDIQKKVL